MERFLRPLQVMMGTSPELSPAKSDGKSGKPVHVERRGAPPLGGVPEWAILSKLAPVLDELPGRLGPDAAIEARIATIADPIDSGLAYQFDITLRALRLGIEDKELSVDDGGFNRDRSWLPWDDLEETEPAAKARAKQCRAVMPGLLLFRGTDPAKPRLLAMLLVGESPTSGLHALAMERALEIAAMFGDRVAAAPPPHAAAAGLERAPAALQITGPSFSGSAHSLRLSLQRWAAHHGPGARTATARRLPRIQIRSGSATGSWLSEQLVSDATTSWLGGSNVEFSATTSPETALRCGYLMFLRCRLGVGRSWLSSCNLADERGPPTPMEGVAMLHESGTEFGSNWKASSLSPTDDGCKVQPGMDISFPVHISALRDAYEKLELPPARAGMIGRATHLDMSLRERSPVDIDAEPSARTTVAEDMALANVLGAISVGSIRIPQHDGFENAQAQGIFNAVLSSRGASPSELREYALGTGLVSPQREHVVLPVWISSIGAGSLVPLSVRPSRDPDCTIDARDGDEQRRCTKVAQDAGQAKLEYARQRDALRNTNLQVDRDASLPRLWHVTFAFVALGWGVDLLLRRRAQRSMSQTRLPGSPAPPPAS